MKPLKVARWVVQQDLQAIYDYHSAYSIPKADRIVEEYDCVIALLESNPLLFRRREGNWRVYAFESGTYLLYYTETENFWLVTGLFHALRDPDWIQARLGDRIENYK